MIEEANLFGIYISSAMIAACVGFIILSWLRRLLRRVGFYRLVWHPALVDIALFGILWSLSAWMLPAIDVNSAATTADQAGHARQQNRIRPSQSVSRPWRWLGRRR